MLGDDSQVTRWKCGARIGGMKFSCTRAFVGLVLAGCVASWLPACQLLTRVDEGEAVQKVELNDKRVFLGEITMVSERSRFVLIKTEVNRRLDPGFPLESFRDRERSGELLFSPEQSFGFMTADITRGAPAVGDGVYLLYSEGFENQMSDRMKFRTEQLARENNMTFLDKQKRKRAKRKAEKTLKRDRKKMKREQAQMPSQMESQAQSRAVGGGRR